jgi:murein DD-endopeptidase MepM/ murein hydrolase activator NlpD
MSVMGRRFLVFSLVLLAACARIGPPAPYELHGEGGVPEASAGPHPDHITVANGDTLYGIARRYGIPTRAIIDANHLQPPYRLVAGTNLALPQVRTHVVRAGDTLAGVARRYGVEMSTLAAVNHLGPPYVIRTGETLVLPAPAETATEPAPPAERPEAVATAPLPPPPSAAPPPPAAAPLPPEPIAVSTPPSAATRGGASAPAAAPRSVPAPATPPTATATPPPPTNAAVSPPAPTPAAPAPPDRLAALPPFPVAGKGFLWPVHGRVISGFGTTADGGHNDGINIAAPAGTPVLAAEAGEVAYAGNELKGYGNLILVKHRDGFVTAYANNAELLVKRGDKVLRGQPIARVGATGAVAEPQLHFEIRKGTQAVDPTDYLPAEAASAAK